MELTIDAKGQECPIPVVRAKKALGTIEEGAVAVLVDNETAVHNLENLGRDLKCAVTSEDAGDGTFRVVLEKTEESAAAALAEAAGTRVVAFGKAVMGEGNDELGAKLMNAFVFSLTQQDVLPDTLLFFNDGVKLTTEGSPVLDDLKKLAEAGVEILSCGTCLAFHDWTEKLAVGEVTNMYVIAQKQLEAGVVVRP